MDILLSTASRHDGTAKTAAAPEKLAIWAFDIDFFKSVNDTYGHSVGDSVICAIAEQLNAVFHRKGDIIARFGGEELTVAFLCSKEDDLHSTLEIAELARQVIEKNCKIWSDGSVGCLGTKGFPLKRDVTTSIGISFVTIKHANMKPEIMEALKQADAALYEAKDNGRNGVYYIDEKGEKLPSPFNPTPPIAAQEKHQGLLNTLTTPIPLREIVRKTIGFFTHTAPAQN